MNPLLGASIGQAAAERRMTETCEIYRLDRDHPTPGTGGRDDYPRTDLYGGDGPGDGRCRWRPQSPADGGGTAATAGESGIVQSYGILHVPMTVTGVRADDLVQLTASADPELPGTVAKVISVTAGAQTTARRIRCMVVTP